MSSRQDGIITNLLNKLKSRQEEERISAVNLLVKEALFRNRDMKIDDFSNWLKELVKKIGQLIASNIVHEKLGGLLAIGNKYRLIEIT